MLQTTFSIVYDFLLKNDINVASKSNNQKNLEPHSKYVTHDIKCTLRIAVDFYMYLRSSSDEISLFRCRGLFTILSINQHTYTLHTAQLEVSMMSYRLSSQTRNKLTFS